MTGSLRLTKHDAPIIAVSTVASVSLAAIFWVVAHHPLTPHVEASQPPPPAHGHNHRTQTLPAVTHRSGTSPEPNPGVIVLSQRQPAHTTHPTSTPTDQPSPTPAPQPSPKPSPIVSISPPPCLTVPEHPARKDDPHYVDFDAYRRKHRPTARCYIGERIGFGDCTDAQGVLCPPPVDGGEQPGLELHHAHVEFSLQQGIDLAALEKDYPGISDATSVGAWVETDVNFRWLCAWHHRGAAGAHTAAHSDWEASQYVPTLIGKASR